MATRILDIGDCMDRTGLARRTLYEAISDGRFPKPVQLTARRVGWIEAEVEAWIAARIADRDGVVAA